MRERPYSWLLWRCWNSIGFEGELLARRTVEAITEKLYELERFDEQFRHMVARAGEDAGGELARKSAQLDKDEQALAAKEENIKKTMAAIGPDPLVLDTLKEIRDEKTRLAVERQRLQQAAKKTTLELPGSVAELRVMLQEEFARLATSPHEFGLLMRKLVPSFSVYLVRL